MYNLEKTIQQSLVLKNRLRWFHRFSGISLQYCDPRPVPKYMNTYVRIEQCSSVVHAKVAGKGGERMLLLTY
jgi:hypothetical protein